MSFIVNDTLQDQIERGEIFFSAFTNISVAEDGVIEYLVTTDVNPCSVNVAFTTNATYLVQVIENPTTAVGGSSQTLFNLRRDSANTIAVTGNAPLTSSSGGTLLWSQFFSNGNAPANSPLGTDAGMILKASEQYIYRFTNYDREGADISLNFTYREIT